MNFISHETPVDLSNCDREPIHIPGQIQAHGALFAVERSSGRIVQVSDNVSAFVGRTPEALLGTALGDVFAAGERPMFERALAQEAVERSPFHLGVFDRNGQRFDVIAHTDGPLAIVELDPIETAGVVAPDFYQFASRTIAGLHGTPTTRDYCQALTGAIHDLTGYDRVMVYKFADDWSGHVIAETMAPDKGLAPFLDLHYPASDIPAQARALFLKNTVRMLPDAQYSPARLIPEINPITNRPLDLSHAFLRGASVMYTEYLVNMGVRASLTLALTEGDRLWGLVACHHYGIRRVSHGVRVVCELVARVASLQIADKLHADEAVYRRRIQAAHTVLVDAMARGENPASSLANRVAVVRDLLDCAGVAVITGGHVCSEGQTPPVPHLRRLALLLSGTRSDEVVATPQMTTVYPDAASFEDVACGMLALPLASGSGDYVMWFRPEQVRSVKWAGDPHKPVTIGPFGDRLTPRKSFALWVETVKGAAEPWTRVEIEAAMRLRLALTEIVTQRSQELERLNRELQRRNEDLDAFAYAVSHDLKEPLRGIYNYAEFLKRDAGDRLAADDVGKLDSIVRLATRLQRLIDSLLHYSRLGRLEVKPETVDLAPLVGEVLDSLRAQLHARNAIVRVQPNQSDWPTLATVGRFVEQIFVNLVSNAIKYNNGPLVEIEIGYERAGSPAFPPAAAGFGHAFFVKDNGIGIPEAHRDTVFRIFKRLHARDKYGGGTGAGLTIVKRLVERLGGDVWIEPRAEGGTTFWFTILEGDLRT